LVEANASKAALPQIKFPGHTTYWQAAYMSMQVYETVQRVGKKGWKDENKRGNCYHLYTVSQKAKWIYLF